MINTLDQIPFNNDNIMNIDKIVSDPPTLAQNMEQIDNNNNYNYSVHHHKHVQ